jgi:hypothetical protein
MKLFERNKKRIEDNKQLDDSYEEYRQLVRSLCPDDFTVRVGGGLDAQFILKESHGEWGFTMDRDVAFNSTSSKSVKQAIDMMARSARLEWSKL